MLILVTYVFLVQNLMLIPKKKVSFLGYLHFDLLLVQNYYLFRRFDANFVSGADLEKYWADDSHIAHTCSLRSLVLPFQVFGP